MFILVGFGLLGLSFGQASGAVTSNFSSQYRYTGAALTSDLSWLIGAGFAPLVALGLSSRFGLGWVSAYLLSGAVCTLASLLFNKLETRESSGGGGFGEPAISTVSPGGRGPSRSR